MFARSVWPCASPGAIDTETLSLPAIFQKVCSLAGETTASELYWNASSSSPAAVLAAGRFGGAFGASNVDGLRTVLPASRDTLVPVAPVPAASWLGAVLRQIVVYCVPPLAAIGLIVLVLFRRDRADAARS